jgi:hypothetical protein
MLPQQLLSQHTLAVASVGGCIVRILRGCILRILLGEWLKSGFCLCQPGKETGEVGSRRSIHHGLVGDVTEEVETNNLPSVGVATEVDAPCYWWGSRLLRSSRLLVRLLAQGSQLGFKRLPHRIGEWLLECSFKISYLLLDVRWLFAHVRLLW